MRHAVLRMSPLCALCAKNGKTTRATEIDHILPLHKGGGHQLENLQPLCSDCHADKTRADCGYKPRHGVGLDGWPL